MADNRRDGELNEMGVILLKLTHQVKKHDFLRYQSKEQCLQILNQIARYFPKHHVQIADEDSEPAKPWINPTSLPNTAK